MAGALLQLENSTRDIKTRAVWKKQVDETIAGLRQLRAGEPAGRRIGIEISDTSLSDSEFKQLVAAVGGEIASTSEKSKKHSRRSRGTDQSRAARRRCRSPSTRSRARCRFLARTRAARSGGQRQSTRAGLMRDGRMAADNAILDALRGRGRHVGAYIEGLERDRPNLESLLISAHNDLAAALTGKRPDSGNPEALLNGIETNLTAWSDRSCDRAARLPPWQQDLRDIAWLAGSSGRSG